MVTPHDLDGLAKLFKQLGARDPEEWAVRRSFRRITGMSPMDEAITYSVNAPGCGTVSPAPAR